MSITSAELAQMRDDIELLLPDTCAILSVTRASDGQGGWTDTWGTATASVKCRLDAINPKGRNQELVIGGAVKPFHTYVLSLPHGTSITTANRVEVSGQTFSVTGVDLGKSWSAVVRCIVEIV